MVDLEKVVQTYEDKGVLLVSDFRACVIAEEILKTVQMLQRWNLGSWESLDIMINHEFSLDICNNHFHLILWENWMKFISDLDLISIGSRWAYPSDLIIEERDIIYLKNVIKDDMF
jgi:hypothetical protein